MLFHSQTIRDPCPVAVWVQLLWALEFYLQPIIIALSIFREWGFWILNLLHVDHPSIMFLIFLLFESSHLNICLSNTKRSFLANISYLYPLTCAIGP